MIRTLRYLLIIMLTGLAGSALAQDGEILGRVTDAKTKDAMINAYVRVTQGGINKGNSVTDWDGNYSIKPLESGLYDLMITFIGYDTIIVTNVSLGINAQTQQDVAMERHSNERPAVVVVGYKKPLVNHFDKTTVFTAEEIKNIPTVQTSDIVSNAAGVYQSQRGAQVQSTGARGQSTLYIIDGVQVQSYLGIDLPQGSIEEVDVMQSGISAKYGDASGAVVNITTRNVAKKMTGNARLQHSIDGYNNNLASFSIAGPLLFKSTGDSAHKTKKPVMGFSLSGDYYDDHNRYPHYYPDYQAKPAVLAALQKTPLKIITDNSGNQAYAPSADYVTPDQLEQVKQPAHNENKEARIQGKLDYQLSDNMHLVAGGMYDHQLNDQFSNGNIMFSPESIYTYRENDGRAYIRFTQKLGKQGLDTSRKSIISNAYYSLQADYQLTSQRYEDPRFGNNIFDYQYVGKFNHQWAPMYFNGQQDSTSSKYGTVMAMVPNQLTYTRSELNPILANYTTEYYNSITEANRPFFLQQIPNTVMINGGYPTSVYGLYTSPGTGFTESYNFSSSQYALTVDASFDLQVGKTRHAIEFGLYYQQRIEKEFAVYSQSGNSIWTLMRGLVSSYDNGGLHLDKANPIFIVGGKHFTYADVKNGIAKPSPTDTIIYNTINSQSSAFDQNLRKKLGLNATQDINVDNLDPNTFSLNMFSADELLNSGNPYVKYYGYTYNGQSQGSVNFNDYWTQKDGNGNYTRPLGAFTPNYIAGYLLDKFTFKDIHFTIGVRIDRYSANTKVLIDPYSEYQETSVSNNVQNTNNVYALNTFNGGKTPTNMAGNYVVYVDDNTSSSPNVVGFRYGDAWYDPTGKAIQDPSVLKQYTGGRDPQPLITRKAGTTGFAKITDSNYNPNSAFTDYNPQVTIVPRLSFSFPISDVADFFAHYDIMEQRPYPTTYGIATAYDYTYLAEHSNQILSNANLRSQQTIDYEVGFQQKLNDHSALTITAYYKERKNQITTVPYLYAFPSTYFTYGNRDFSSTKGTTMSFDYRATNHLSMTIGYTLQFAEGTGSDPNSANSGSNSQPSTTGLLQQFVAAGTPNLRYITPLNYDARHTFNANINYRYKQGEGPEVYGKHVLENAGIALIAKARSGEPYTKLTNPNTQQVIGGVNGARIPWHYGFDLKVNKDFNIYRTGRNKDAVTGIKPKKPVYLSAFIYVNNLLNTREVMGVYGYTGRPDNDGYLASAFGRKSAPQQLDPATYSNLYSIAKNDPGHYNYARTINFGIDFNF